MVTEITRVIEIDYGHTLPEHYGFCNQLHGHRGRIEATFSANIQDSGSENGMVLDFKICKQLMHERIADVLDHGFAIWNNHDVDRVLVNSNYKKEYTTSTLAFIKARNDRVLILDKPPTAEVLAWWAFDQLESGLRKYPEVLLVKLRWYETPNNFAEVNYVHKKG